MFVEIAGEKLVGGLFAPPPLSWIGLKALVPYGYAVILSKILNLLSSLLPSAISLISLVYTPCVSLLHLCCDISMVLLFNKQFLNH